MRGCVLLSILTACSLGQTAEEGPDVTVNGDSLVVVNGEVYGSDVAATPEDGAVDSPGTQERVVRIDDATTSVHVLGSIPVFVTLGPEPGAMVSCDRNRMSGIIVDNKPDHLLVMGDVGSSGEGCSVTVTVSSLDDVRSMGSAEVVLSELSGDLSISLLGSGDIIANGVAPRLTLDSLGSGSIKADGLVGTDATVTLTGSGDVFFNASATANLTLMGSGDIHLTGAARPHPGDLQAPMGGWHCRRHVHTARVRGASGGAGSPTACAPRPLPRRVCRALCMAAGGCSGSTCVRTAATSAVEEGDARSQCQVPDLGGVVVARVRGRRMAVSPL